MSEKISKIFLETKKAADFISKSAAWFAVYSAENGQKNNGHTIQKDCVTVFISVVLPTLLRQLFTGADCG